MKRLLIALLALAPVAALANDFPTIERVNYVMACMAGHKDQLAYLYKCSCEVDAIAKQVPFSVYDSMETAWKAQTIAGEGGGIVRDPKEMKDLLAKYKKVTANAIEECDVH